MSKTILVEEITNKHSLNKNEAGEIVDLVFNKIKETVEKDGKFTIIGFGSFKKVKTKARLGHNPKTGEPIDIPEREKIKFTPSKSKEN